MRERLQIREPMRFEAVHGWLARGLSGDVDPLEAVRLSADASMADQPAPMPGGR